jgi:hypothetical protein
MVMYVQYIQFLLRIRDTLETAKKVIYQNLDID